MKRFNAWLRDALPPTGWKAYAAMYEYSSMRPRGIPGTGQIEFPAQSWSEFFGRRPADVSAREWEVFATNLARWHTTGESGIIESWVMAGLCAKGVRCYRPTADDYLTLSRTEMNFPLAQYRQPFETYCLVMPPELYSDPIPPDFGAPAVVMGRHDPVNRVFCCLAMGLPAGTTLNNWGTWDDASPRTFEDRIADVVDISEDHGMMRLNQTEEEFFARAQRAYVNACMLLTSYGTRHMGPANPEYAARLTASLGKRGLPDGARTNATAELARMPHLYAVDQVITLRERVDSIPHDPTGRHVRPHWRRGHWANVRCGTGRADTRRVFRKELFVNLGRGGTPPTRVEYK